jgi:hypothetical protein
LHRAAARALCLRRGRRRRGRRLLLLLPLLVELQPGDGAERADRDGLSVDAAVDQLDREGAGLGPLVGLRKVEKVGGG